MYKILRNMTLASSLSLLCSFGYAQSWDPKFFNPKPIDDDVILPLPCEGFMAFRKVLVPVKKPLDDFAVGHRDYFIELLSYIPQGKSALDPEVQKLIPKKLRPTSGFKNSYQRIIGDAPSPTITRNFTTPSSANCIHPSQDRALSIREGARCQSFPDWFYFLGTTDEKRLQIGNAVPPLLGKAIGESILNAIDASMNIKVKV